MVPFCLPTKGVLEFPFGDVFCMRGYPLREKMTFNLSHFVVFHPQNKKYFPSFKTRRKEKRQERRGPTPVDKIETQMARRTRKLHKGGTNLRQ